MRLTQTLRFKIFRRDIFYNNQFQLTRLKTIRNLEVKEKLEDRGFDVVEPQAILDAFPFLPAVPVHDLQYDVQRDDPVKAAFANQREHPLYKKKVAWTYDQHTKYHRDIQFDSARVSAIVSSTSSTLSFSCRACSRQSAERDCLSTFRP